MILFYHKNHKILYQLYNKNQTRFLETSFNILRGLVSSLLLLSTLVLSGCKQNETSTDLNSVLYNLIQLETYSLDEINEPSGLSWALNGEDLLVVDDDKNEVYIINTEGELITTLNYSGDDLEGISINSESQTIWVAEERESDIVEIDLFGNELQRHHLNIDRSSQKNSLEGISYDEDNKIFYILNEANPGLLITLQEDMGITNKISLNFAEDYSGLFFDVTDQTLWIISDKSQQLFHCELNGEVIQSFNIDIDKAEGVVVDNASNRVYIVSDADQELTVFSLESQDIKSD